MNATFPPRREAGGFTLVELLVVIGIIALLISILLPTLSRARDSAKAVKCGSNVRQIAQGLVGYGTEFNGTFPVGFGFLGYNGAYAEGTGDGPATVEMWVTAVSGYLNANRENDYNLPWLTSAIAVDPDDNYHPVLYCPNVASEFDDQWTHYAPNMTIMPDWYYDQYFGDPGLLAASHKPMNFAQVYSENALLWDGVQTKWTVEWMATTDRTNSVFLYPSPGYTGVDGANLSYFGVRVADFDMLYRDEGNESIANIGLPERSVEWPAFINPPGQLDDNFWHNEDLLVGANVGIYYHVAGAPIFRHNARERCQVGFADGSVRALKWNPGDEHEGGYYVTSEMTRNMLRPKYPNPLPRPRPNAG